MEHPVSVRLGHLGVDVVAAVAELGDLLGEELDPLSGVAEDDALVDLQLGEERVEAVDLLPLLHEGVVLGDALEGELIHQVDLVGVAHVLPHEGLDGQGEGGGIQQDLSRLREVTDQPAIKKLTTEVT